MSRRPELFTPEGFSPALAELDLEDMTIPERLIAAEGLLRQYSTIEALDAAASLFESRDTDPRDWGQDTPTHYKWLLGAANPDDPRTARIFLHQYKVLPPGASRCFTENDHTHSDGVVASMLRKGYSAVERRFPGMPTSIVVGTRDVAIWSEHYNWLQETAADYDEGDIMSIHPDEVHRLDRIAPGTMSLVIRPPTCRDFSVMFEPGSHEPVIIDDMRAKRMRVAATIRNILAS